MDCPEQQWLTENQDRYDGQWVWIEGKTLRAASSDPLELIAAVRAAGAKRPFIVQVVTPKLPFGGW